MKSFKQEMISNPNNSFFPPVFTPGLGQKEHVEDSGLKTSMGYLNNVGVDGKDALDAIYKNYPASMIDEMVAVIRKHKPDVTDAELAITITHHL